MLEPAKAHEDELNGLIAKHGMDPKLKWMQLGFNDVWYTIDDNDYAQIQMVSLHYNILNHCYDVIGYFKAALERQAYFVTNLMCVNFSEDKMTFAMDVRRFLNILAYEKKFKKISWAVTVGNPVEKHYDSIVKKVGGRIVGIEKKDTFIDGKYYDRKLYEWINDYYECTNCGYKEKKEKEITCWKCGIGEMVYYDPFK